MRRSIRVHAAEVWLLHFNTTRPLTAGTFIAANVAAVQQNAMRITKQPCGRGTNTPHSTLGIHTPFKCYIGVILIKRFCTILVLLVALLSLCACTQSEKVSHNLSKEADQFNVTRKITVINIRNNEILYEIIAKCSLQNNSSNELEVISEVSAGHYKKDFVYLSDWVTYVVQDVTGAYTDPYHYEINILPYAKGIAGNITLDLSDD